MVEIKLPCEIGMWVKNKDNGFEYRIIGYEIRGKGIPFDTSYIAMAQAININDNNNLVLISSQNGIFPDSIEIIGY